MTNSNSLIVGWLIKQNQATGYVQKVYFKLKVEYKFLCKYITGKK